MLHFQKKNKLLFFFNHRTIAIYLISAQESVNAKRIGMFVVAAVQELQQRRQQQQEKKSQKSRITDCILGPSRYCMYRAHTASE